MAGACALFTAHGIDPSQVVPGSLTIDYQTCHVTYQRVGPEAVVRPFTAHDVICPRLRAARGCTSTPVDRTRRFAGQLGA